MERLTINLNTETADFLRKMKDELDMTYTATVWRSVSLFAYILRLQSNGGTITATDKSGKSREIRIIL